MPELSAGVRRPERYVDHSPPFSVEAETEWNFVVGSSVYHRDTCGTTLPGLVIVQERHT